MIRVWMLTLVVVVIMLQVFDRSYVRNLTAKKEVVAISSAEGRIYPLKVEEQEIVNNESVLNFAEKAAVKILNFRPGKLKQHFEDEGVRELFISKSHYDKFYAQMEVWANSEFSLNNISIKEAVVSDIRLVRSPYTPGRSFRLFEAKARVPTYDRAVGDSEIGTLEVDLKMIYLGPKSGMGLYRVNIRYL
jgi:hypothetical protein